jgi:hypothetical protein
VFHYCLDVRQDSWYKLFQAFLNRQGHHRHCRQSLFLRRRYKDIHQRRQLLLMFQILNYRPGLQLVHGQQGQYHQLRPLWDTMFRQLLENLSCIHSHHHHRRHQYLHHRRLQQLQVLQLCQYMVQQKCLRLWQ